MQQLRAIGGVRGAVVGGLAAWIRLVPASNVPLLPLVVEMNAAGTLELTDPDNYADVFGAAGQYTQTSEYGPYGLLWQQKLTLQVPGQAPDVADAVARLLAVRHFVALVPDAQGLTHLVGSPDWPLELRVEQTTGGRAGDFAGQVLTLQAQSAEPSVFYQAIEAQAPPRKVFSAGFSFGFQRTP